jgi:hypothetical protein
MGETTYICGAFARHSGNGSSEGYDCHPVAVSSGTALHRGMPDTTTWTTTAEVAVSSGTALHRGDAMDDRAVIAAVTRSPFLRGTALHRGWEGLASGASVLTSRRLSGTALHRGTYSWNRTRIVPGRRRFGRPLHRGHRLTVTPPLVLRVAVFPGTALHRGMHCSVVPWPGGSGRCPPSGRPFIEAWKCRCPQSPAGRSPPLSWRPFIEACRPRRSRAPT